MRSSSPCTMIWTEPLVSRPGRVGTVTSQSYCPAVSNVASCSCIMCPLPTSIPSYTNKRVQRPDGWEEALNRMWKCLDCWRVRESHFSLTLNHTVEVSKDDRALQVAVRLSPFSMTSESLGTTTAGSRSEHTRSIRSIIQSKGLELYLLHLMTVSKLWQNCYFGVKYFFPRDGKQNRYELRDWDGTGTNLIGSGQDRE